MKRHSTDLVSLAFGLVFVGIAGWWLIGHSLLDMHLNVPNLGLFMAGGLILLGLLGVVGSLRREPKAERGGDTATATAPPPPVAQPTEIITPVTYPETTDTAADPYADAEPSTNPYATAEPGTVDWTDSVDPVDTVDRQDTAEEPDAVDEPTGVDSDERTDGIDPNDDHTGRDDAKRADPSPPSERDTY
jgi:hypothetical protein